MKTPNQRIGILGLGAYTPERVMENEEWSHYVDTSDEWITSRTGIHRRRVAADDESTVDLAVAAARRALDAAKLDPEALDEIIVATDTPEVTIPDTAAYVQHRLGARQIPTYDLGGSGCAGWVQGLDIARSRVYTGKGKVLVIGVELLTRFMDWHDRSTCVLFGDAAGAAIVGETSGAGELLAVDTGTDGSQTGILNLEVGGTKKPITAERVEQSLHQHIFMSGPEVFKAAVGHMTASALRVLAAAGRELTEIDLIVPHQANRRIIDAVSKRLKTPSEKVFVNVQDYGNTGSASVPLALTQAIEQERLQQGDLVLITTFGAGFHWASALIQF
jgi:3-oxoacyl-[acyl-carrier-protein] synthase-3